MLSLSYNQIFFQYINFNISKYMKYCPFCHQPLINQFIDPFFNVKIECKSCLFANSIINNKSYYLYSFHQNIIYALMQNLQNNSSTLYSSNNNYWHVIISSPLILTSPSNINLAIKRLLNLKAFQ